MSKNNNIDSNTNSLACQECSGMCENINSCDISNSGEVCSGNCGDCEMVDYLDVDEFDDFEGEWVEMSYRRFVEKSLEFRHSQLGE